MQPYRTLRERGLRAKRELGQHILVDERAIQRIVEAASLTRSDTVLEVGPGPGTLTVHLAERAGCVVAVELDEQMVTLLRESLGHLSSVRIVHGDILDQDIATLVGGKAYKVVANLPYYITSAVLRHVFEAQIRPTVLVATVQREVAERIMGRSGKRSTGGRGTMARMSLLGVSVQFYGTPQIVARIPAGAFRPVPAVDSAVVRVDVYDPLPWDVEDKDIFFRTVRAGFAQARKQLRNALAHNLQLPVESVLAALERAGIDSQRRAETLSVEEWAALSNVIARQANLHENQTRGIESERSE